MKKILVLSGGYYTRLVQSKLAAAGFYVITADRDASAPAAVLSDKFAAVDVVDMSATLELAKENQIDGVMAVNDIGVPTAAYVAEKLGLPGIYGETAQRCIDKALMRSVWRNAEVPIPNFRLAATQDEAVAFAAEIGFPCVFKPRRSSAGRGISVAHTVDQAKWSAKFAWPHCRGLGILVEHFLEGTELTVESISYGGQVHILAISDKVKPDLRTRVATSLNYSAEFEPEILAQIEDVARSAVTSLGINIGMAHTELILTSEGPKLVETGARGGGGHIFHTCIEAVSGINAPVACAHLLTGESLDLPKATRKGAVYRFFNPPPGILREVRGLDKLAELPYVLDYGMLKAPGDTVGVLVNSLERAGFVVTSGETRDLAIDAADRAEKLIEFVVDSLPEDSCLCR